MKRKVGLVGAGLISALLGGTGLVSSDAFAQTAPAATDAIAQTDPVPFWWFHGSVEAGGRFFLNNPTRNGSAYLGQTSLAKYYEYSSVKPGPFSNIWLSTGSKDGLYRIDLAGANIGYSDQSYYLNASKAGQHYFNFGWDQTPHFYSTSAQTPYLGVGTNNLTLPPALLGTGAMTATRLAPFLNTTDIGIKRDTAAADYRWTPTDAWDIKADYSHLSRTGTQVDGLSGFNSAASPENPTQVPRPVKDSTQNYGLNGEYAGSTSWGKITAKAGYVGSQYTEDYQSYTIQNPYCTTAGGPCNGTQSPVDRMSLWPSNQANGFNGTVAADLPLKSRYAGTVSYTMMRQNDSFQPMSNNPAAVYALPANSLNGAINTTLVNNVITSQITSELKSKVTYRYYDYQNNTPELLFANWLSNDQSGSAEGRISSLSMDYRRQNAGGQLNWRPTNQWNLTADYGFEHNAYTRMDADATNENTGKLSADWKPTSWVTFRSSGSYADRRYNNYDHQDYMRLIQEPTTGPGTTLSNSWTYTQFQRQVMLDNRQETKANLFLDLVVAPGLTITPTYKYKDDNYKLDPNTELGLSASRVQSGGVDLAYVPIKDLSFVFGYLREYYKQSVQGYSTSNIAFGLPLTSSATAFPIGISATDTVDTFTANVNYWAVPDKLELNLRYAASRAVDSTLLLISPIRNNGTPNPVTSPVGGQWTDVTNWFQRLDATAIYKFDRTQVAQIGFNGDVKLKLRYTWERNSVSNWQQDPLAPVSPGITGTPSAIWLASDNPNYNVHMLAASFIVGW